MRRLLLCLAVAGLSAAVFGYADKYVAAGWQFASARPDHLLTIADQLDRTSLDGCILYLDTTSKSGLNITSRNIIHQPAWDWSDLEPLVPQYRQLLAHKAFRHSFLNSYRAPTNRVAWTDDAAWTRIAHNLRLVARLAKRSGFVGLQMDPEDYHRQCQYDYRPSDAPTYAAAALLARRRGAEVFRGVFEEFPDMTLLSYWLASMDVNTLTATDGRNLQLINARIERDLWTPFLDGLFDVLPPTATLIDGLEHGYTWEADRGEYYRGASLVHQNLVHLLAPENRPKYHQQMRNAFGVYLDAYSTVTNGGFCLGPVHGSRLTHLKLNLLQATAAADEYLWLWGERGCWHDPGKSPYFTQWEKLLPGLNDALEALKDPAAAGRRLRLRGEAGALKPLNENCVCEPTSVAALPKPYSSWQEPASRHYRQGTFGLDRAVGHGDKTSLYAEGVERGCLNVPAVTGREPGDLFAITFCSRGRHVSASVGWRTGSGWNWKIPRALIPVTGEPDAAGWTRTDWSVMIPPGADGFGLMLNVEQQPGERCWFDDIAIYAFPKR